MRIFYIRQLCFSSASIRIVGGDYLQNLYSTGYQQYKVLCKRGNDVIWTGFINPELYTQDYTSTKFELEIECSSAMSTLEYVNYKQKNAEQRTFISFWELFRMFIDAVSAGIIRLYLFLMCMLKTNMII